MTTDRRDGCNGGTRVPLYVLAGGKSRRFGSNKARAVVDGVPLVAAVVGALAPVTSSIAVVAAADDEYQDLGLRTIGDVIPAKGPLGGLLTALVDLDEPGWLLLAACDWVGMRAEWVRQLLAARRTGANAVVFRSHRYEPLLGLYHSGIEALVRTKIDSEDLSMQSLLDGATTVSLAVPGDWNLATNLNRLPDNELSGRPPGRRGVDKSDKAV